jgi:hypothetical protein
MPYPYRDEEDWVNYADTPEAFTQGILGEFNPDLINSHESMNEYLLNAMAYE